MQLKEHLLEAFTFNDIANKKLLNKVKSLANTAESAKLFSHLVNTQNKWMAAIEQDPIYEKMSWWDPVYDLDRLGEEWDKSITIWIKYLGGKSDEELLTETASVNFENVLWAAVLKDIVLQLNYHSIHHRAQIQILIRQQGIEPDFLDYIGMKVKKVNP